MTVVDAHAHVISRDQHRYPIAPPGGVPPEWLDARRVDADDLLERMDSVGVDQAVLVQFVAAHGYDNRYVLDCASEHPERFVAVCALDGRDAISRRTPGRMRRARGGRRATARA